MCRHLQRNIKFGFKLAWPGLLAWSLIPFAYAEELFNTHAGEIFTEVLIESRTTFKLGKADFSSAAPFALDEFVERLEMYSGVEEIQIIGHSCDVASASFNNELSERRAKAVAYYLRTHGVDAIPLKVVTPGEVYTKYSAENGVDFGNKSRVEILFSGELTQVQGELKSPSIVAWEEIPQDAGQTQTSVIAEPCVNEEPDDSFLRMRNFSVGQMTLTPTFGISLGYDTNITNASDQRKESWFIVLSPGIKLELPSDRSLLTLSYAIDAGYYDGSRVDNFIDQTLRASYDFDPTTRTGMGLFGEYKKGHERRGEGARAGDRGLLNIDPDEYDLYRFGGNWSYGAVGARGKIELRADIDDYNFTDKLRSEFGEVINRDRDGYGWGGTFFWRIAPKTSGLFEYRWRNIDYTDGSLDSEETRYLLGVTWEATAKTTGTVKYGWLEKEFDAFGREDYDGTTWEAVMDWRPRSYSTFALRASRNTSETDGFGDYVLRDNLSLDWRHNWTTRFSSTFDIGVGNEDHRPDPREDDYYYVGFSGRYRFNRYFQLGGGLTYQERDSNTREFTNDGLIYLLSVELSY